MMGKFILDRVKSIQRASWVGIAGNSIISLIKLIVGYLTGSLAIFADGVDSSTDILTSIITLITAPIASKPPDKKHPYGHGRAETIATKLLSFIISFAGIQLLFSTIDEIVNPKGTFAVGYIAFIATGISLIGKTLLAVYKKSIGGKVNSQMLIADAKNMQNDILLSGMVLISLLLGYFIETNFIDRVMAITISIFIIKTGVSIFWETSTELMDGITDESLYQRVYSAIKKVDGANNPHRVRIRKMNNEYIIDLDIEVEPSITVIEAHKISVKVENKIKSSIDNVYDIIVHIEPDGCIDLNEKFGNSEF